MRQIPIVFALLAAACSAPTTPTPGRAIDLTVEQNAGQGKAVERHRFAVYDVSNSGLIQGASVTVTQQGGASSSGLTDDSGSIVLTTDRTGLDRVVVTAGGYCTFDQSVDVGVREQWTYLGLTPGC